MRSDRIRRPLAAAVLLALAGAIAWPTGVGAQSGDVAALENRVARLEQDIANLRRLVTSGETLPSQNAAESGQPLPPTSAAQLQVRMSQLEEELRSITGRMEEVSFQVQQLNSRMDTTLSDIEYRLTALEGGEPAAPSANAGQSGGSGGQPSNNPPAMTPPDQGDGPTQVVPPPANGGGESGPTETASVELPEGTAAEQYDHAKSLLRQREFEEAAGVLQAFIDAHPDAPLTGNAYYWLGETYYVRGQYDQAIAKFGAGYKTFPEHPKAPDNLLKLAMSLGKSGRKPQACAAFTELQRKYPDAGTNLKSIARQESQSLGC